MANGIIPSFPEEITDLNLVSNTVFSTGAALPVVGHTFAMMLVTTGVVKLIEQLKHVIFKEPVVENNIYWGIKNISLGTIYLIPIIGNITAAVCAIFYGHQVKMRRDAQALLEGFE